MMRQTWRQMRGFGRASRIQSGMTIIEVLLATVILGIGLIGVGSMVTYGVISHQKSQNYTVASARATEELERIREATYTGAVIEATLFPSSAGYTIVNSTQVSFPISDLTGGVGLITLADDSEATATNPSTGLPYSNLKRATVAIGWSGSRYLRGAYTATTLIANRPT